MPNHHETEILRALGDGRIRGVLAIRASRIGDLLMTTPALHAFRERWPAPKITFLTNRYSRALLEHNPDIAEVLVFDGREPELAGAKGRNIARSIRDGGGIDLLLALRPRRELAAFADRAGIRYLWPPEDPDPNDRSRHVVEQCFARLRPLVDGTPGPLQLRLAPEERTAAASVLPEGQGPLVLAHPGCDETIRWKPRRGVRKRVWPVAHWSRCLAELRAQLDARIVVTSGSDTEARWVDRILERSPTAEARHVRKPTLRRLAALASHAAAVVTVDTGPLHVATAVGTPTIGLYGPSPPSYTGPWSPGGRAEVLRRELPCAPCQGRDVRCLRNVCMEEIRVDDVVDAVAQACAEA